jgi:hypothetical protein
MPQSKKRNRRKKNKVITEHDKQMEEIATLLINAIPPIPDVDVQIEIEI